MEHRPPASAVATHESGSGEILDADEVLDHAADHDALEVLLHRPRRT